MEAGLPGDRSSQPARGGRAVRIIGRFAYWVAVLAVSLALVIGLVLFFESRDQSSLEGAEDGDTSAEPDRRPSRGDDG